VEGQEVHPPHHVPGGLVQFSAEQALQREPTRLVEDAVRRMLPRTALGRALMKKLRSTPATSTPTPPRSPSPWKRRTHEDSREMAKDLIVSATGRRKESIARVRMKPGSGEFVVTTARSTSTSGARPAR